MPRHARPKPDSVQCPFTILVDTQEQLPYHFLDIRTNKDKGNLPVVVPTQRIRLRTGDYTIFGMYRVLVERKSKSDLFQSVARRENFEDRLQRMQDESDYSAVVVEAEWSECFADPPRHPRTGDVQGVEPKALFRTVIAWQQRYPIVHWWMMPGRDAAEQATFRMLERYYLDRTADKR